MSRLDHHIAVVRNKLTFAEFLHAGAQALLIVALGALAYAIMRQFTLMILPHESWLLPIAAGLAVVYGLAMALRRRPSATSAATAIDQRLELKEKFSTALFARNSDDPFAAAAVVDAERAAVDANLKHKFPLSLPRAIIPAICIALVAAGLFGLVEPRNLFASTTPPNKPKPVDVKEAQAAKDVVKQTIAKIDQAPKAAADKESIKLAKGELAELLKKPDFDPAAARRKALSALQDLSSATEQIKASQKFAEAKKQEQLLDKLAPGKDQSGPVADAQRELSKGNFQGAINKLDDVTKKFDQMSAEKQQQAAQQMQQMAQQLQKMANDPQQQQRMQQQMQQLGMNQQQVQQAQKLMQQAAQGNQQAAQQLQQMAQQAMKQMNGGQGPTQQQVAQAQQMLKQMQAQTNNAQQAQQLQQAAQQMAQAMQQAASAAQGRQAQGQQGQQQSASGQQQAQQAGQQGNQGQQANGQKPGGQQGQQPGGQQGQQANAGQQGNQPGQQSGNQPGGQQGGGQSMQQAMSNMQDQLQQMQAVSQDAQQVAAAQQGAQDAADDLQNQMNGQQQGNQDQGNQNPGPHQNGPQGQQMGHGFQGVGGKGESAEAPFTVKQEVSKSQDNAKGRIIAATLIKADPIKGESHIDTKAVAQASDQESTDEVDNERVGRAAQKAVKDYFGSVQDGK